MEIYLYIVFIILVVIIVKIVINEYQAYKAPRVVRTEKNIIEYQNVPYQEVGFSTYKLEEFQRVDFNEAIVLEYSPPVVYNGWIVEARDKQLNLVGEEIIGETIDVGEKVYVILTSNDMFFDYMVRIHKFEKCRVIRYHMNNYDPSNKYTFIMRAPNDINVKMTAYKLRSEDIKTSKCKIVEKRKTTKYVDENKIISTASLNTGIINSISKYGTIIEEIDVYLIKEPNSRQLKFTTNSFILNKKQKMCIFYVDHCTTNHGAMYSRVNTKNITNNTISTYVTGNEQSRNHSKSGVKCGIIKNDVPGEYVIWSNTGPTTQAGLTIIEEAVIKMKVFIVKA
jgi:hypothetical protein